MAPQTELNETDPKMYGSVRFDEPSLKRHIVTEQSISMVPRTAPWSSHAMPKSGGQGAVEISI